MSVPVLGIIQARRIESPDQLLSDFFSALKTMFDGTPKLVAAFPGGFFEIDKPVSPDRFPYVVISDLHEVEPGESLEDRAIDMTVTIRGDDSDIVVASGELLMNWFDPGSPPKRPRIQWTTGYETFNWRENSAITKPDRRIKGGRNWYEYDIPYRFWIFDERT
ncbi:MAG: hypothetical protein KGL39_39255 [Patescibacteria group bacterium]|nr:hypothetical protein [Patescibacteria group bacterium]